MLFYKKCASFWQDGACSARIMGKWDVGVTVTESDIAVLQGPGRLLVDGIQDLCSRELQGRQQDKMIQLVFQKRHRTPSIYSRGNYSFTPRNQPRKVSQQKWWRTHMLDASTVCSDTFHISGLFADLFLSRICEILSEWSVNTVVSCKGWAASSRTENTDSYILKVAWSCR